LAIRIELNSIFYGPSDRTCQLSPWQRAMKLLGVVCSNVDCTIDLSSTWTSLSSKLSDLKWKRKVTSACLKALPLELNTCIPECIPYRWICYDAEDVTSIEHGVEIPPPPETDVAYPRFAVSDKAVIRDTPRGKAWIAKNRIPIGTTILIERCIGIETPNPQP